MCLQVGCSEKGQIKCLKIEISIDFLAKTRYNIYTISEDGYNIYNSHKVDTVDTLEQAEDRESELKAETGMNAYYEKVDEWWETNYKKLIDYVNQETPEAIANLVYNGNIDEYMDNTSKQIALDIYNQLGKDVVEKMLNNIKLDNPKFIKKESVQPAYKGKDLSDFKLLLKAFDNNGRHAQRGNWEIGRGGYDMWYEIYYNKVPVIRCINGNVEVETEGYEDYAKLTAEQYGDTYIDTLTEGNVTTTSGTYDIRKYDEICDKVKKAYKDAWEGKISYRDLEAIKKNSGLSNGELSSIQYSASRETDKKEENKSLSTLKTKLINKVNKVLQKSEYGFDKDEIKDYIVVEVNKLNDEEIKVEVRAELDYEAFNKLIDELDPIIQAYDNNSYFDMEDTGIAVAYINNKSKKITECDDEEYSDETNWAEEEASEADDRFENRYMNGGNGATFTKRKTESVEDNKEAVNPEEVKGGSSGRGWRQRTPGRERYRSPRSPPGR